MSVLIVMGSGVLWITMPIAMGVAGLVLLVIFSYLQTIRHDPRPARWFLHRRHDNLGRWPALVAGAALLTDYILTVSVSSAAGVRVYHFGHSGVQPYSILLAIGAILFIAWINLRGMRESGSVFAIPTYAFVVGVLLVIVIGFVRYLGLFGVPPLPVESVVVPALHPVEGVALIWLLLRAFAGGCTALTASRLSATACRPSRNPNWSMPPRRWLRWVSSHVTLRRHHLSVDAHEFGAV